MRVIERRPPFDAAKRELRVTWSACGPRRRSWLQSDFLAESVEASKVTELVVEEDRVLFHVKQNPALQTIIGLRLQSLALGVDQAIDMKEIMSGKA